MKNLKALILGSIIVSSSFVNGQNFETSMPVGKQFIIQSAMNYNKDNGGYWDIPGKPNSISKGSNIQVWALDAGIDRKFTLLNNGDNGYYEITVGNTKNSRIDIDNGNSANGTNVKVWDSNNGTAQRFAFEHLGNGRFKIFDKNGKIICLANRSNKNGSNVHIWDNHNGAFTEWYLIDPTTKKAFVPKPTPKPAAQKQYDVKDIILHHHQTTLEDCFAKISLSELKSNGENIVTESFNELNQDEKNTRIIYILNGVKRNNNVEVRKSIYSQLTAVQYEKLGFANKMLLNAYFDKYNDPQLQDYVNDLQSKVVQ